MAGAPLGLNKRALMRLPYCWVSMEMLSSHYTPFSTISWIQLSDEVTSLLCHSRDICGRGWLLCWTLWGSIKSGSRFSFQNKAVIHDVRRDLKIWLEPHWGKRPAKKRVWTASCTLLRDELWISLPQGLSQPAVGLAIEKCQTRTREQIHLRSSPFFGGVGGIREVYKLCEKMFEDHQAEWPKT